MDNCFYTHIPARLPQVALFTKCRIGKERLLAYNSKRLEDSSKSLTANEMEMTGITISVLAFSHIVKSTVFEIYCDHMAIPYNLGSSHKIPTMKLQRFFDRLSRYTFKIGWEARKSLKVVD